MSDEVAKIAGSLTRAQRRMLFSLPLPALSSDWRTFPALKRKGLLEVSTDRFSRKLIATPLGLAVRDHINKEKADD